MPLVICLDRGWEARSGHREQITGKTYLKLMSLQNRNKLTDHALGVTERLEIYCRSEVRSSSKRCMHMVKKNPIMI